MRRFFFFIKKTIKLYLYLMQMMSESI